MGVMVTFPLECVALVGALGSRFGVHFLFRHALQQRVRTSFSRVNVTCTSISLPQL